jgi:hypothetical protein
MADGNTHGFDYSTLRLYLRKRRSKIRHFQEFPTRQVKTMFTGGFLFRKVLFCFVLVGRCRLLKYSGPKQDPS